MSVARTAARCAVGEAAAMLHRMLGRVSRDDPPRPTPAVPTAGSGRLVRLGLRSRMSSEVGYPVTDHALLSHPD